MDVQYHVFYSSHIGRDMELKSYGHGGKPIVVFPSSGGRFFEYEDFLMVDACRPFVEEGSVRLYAVDSIDKESWLDKGKSAADRGSRHNDYDRYIVEELAPFVRQHAAYDGGLLATGCSMGAYHALNFYLRHPDVFDGTIALSGVYDGRFFVGEQLHEPAVYYNSPVDYTAQIDDPWYLDRYRSGTIVVCTGQGAWEEEAIRDTRRMDQIFRDKDVPAWIDYWGYDVDHDWPWWRVQMPYFLGKLQEQGKLR